jgi:endogenous inhibitor of DNA gyrase (YacG/DUF329 family)
MIDFGAWADEIHCVPGDEAAIDEGARREDAD